MSDWENDDEPAAPVKPAFVPKVGRKKFEDEDAEDEIKDHWEEEDEPAKPAAPVAPAKKKGTVKQKIAEKEAAERRRQELGLDSDEEEEEEEEDPVERRKREKEAQIKADIENAAALLGTSKISSDDPLAKLKNACPASKEDWEAFSNQLFSEILKKQSTRPGYDKNFVPHFTRLVCSGIRDVDIRKTATKLRELAEEKVREEKEAKKGGGVKKAAKPKTVGTASAKNTVDTTAYGDEALDDDLDFM